METMEEFVNSLASVGVLRQARDAAVRAWGDDISITLLFARLGRAIAEDFDALPREEKAHVFDVIEQGMKSGNTVLSTAVATGLLEAISAKTSEDPDLAGKIDVHLGAESKKYLIAWENWLNNSR